MRVSSDVLSDKESIVTQRQAAGRSTNRKHVSGIGHLNLVQPFESDSLNDNDAAASLPT
jgi:hypothetical protein